MQNYEVMTLVKGSLGDQKAKDLSKKIGGFIDSLGGKIEKTDFWGKRKLAYKIKQETEGFYEVLNISLPSERLDSLIKKLNLENGLVRYLITAKS